MIESYIKTYKYDNGEIQRVQAVSADSFRQLHFLRPAGDERAFTKIVSLYRDFIVVKAPWVFPRMVLVYLPRKLFESAISDGPDMSAEAQIIEMLRKYVRVNAKGELRYGNMQAKEFCEKLIGRGHLAIISGRLPHTKILPVGNTLGYLSESMPEAKVKVNSNFFVMDCFDVASGIDRIGMPIGLMVENGKVLNPPAFGREALLVTAGESSEKIEIRPLNTSEMTFVINGEEYSEAIGNATVYERPGTSRIGRRMRGRYAVIAGNRVEAVYGHGGFDVPGSGVVLRINSGCAVKAGDAVEYRGLEQVIFGIQVGNSIIVDGEKTTGFRSHFYNIYRHLGSHAYPPSLYPLDYNKARAPRIALGALKDGRPCIIWAEGPKKTGYIPGEQSCGASLSEMAEIAQDIGLRSAVNLDGGGSAQILLDGKRELEISDRNRSDGSEEERAVPAGIYVK